VEGSVDREWLFRELRRSLRLLAADGDAALAGVPDGCCRPDELALDFDNFRSAVVGNFADELPSELVAGLAEVDVALAGIQGEGWSEEAMRTTAEWAAVRAAAAGALGRLDRFEDKP
jgi:hypothetical protein